MQNIQHLKVKYLWATGLLKDSIWESVDMIVSSDGELGNPILENPIICMLLTEIEPGKLNQEKQI